MSIRRLLFVSLLFTASHIVAGAPPYALTHPPSLSAPQVSTSLMGATYAYLSMQPGAALRLMITVMRGSEITRQLGALGSVECVNLFVEQLRSEHSGFFVTSMTRPLTIGTHEFPQFRWTGDKDGRTLTGILSCARLGQAYYAIHLVDDLRSAARSFAEIRAALKTLVPVQP